MNVGIILPTFRGHDRALHTASEAEEAGLDGVFVYDHLWPIGSPHLPSLSLLPALGAIAASTSTICFGSLVARVGLNNADELMAAFSSLELIGPGRLVAGIGIGDSLSRPENVAYGLAQIPIAERRAEMVRLARGLADRGADVWIGGNAPATTRAAVEAGVTVNLWDVDSSAVHVQSQSGPVTWAGPCPEDPQRIFHLLRDLAACGAKWAVLAVPKSIADVADAARTLAGSKP